MVMTSPDQSGRGTRSGTSTRDSRQCSNTSNEDLYSGAANVKQKQLKCIGKTLKMLIKCLTKQGKNRAGQVDSQDIPTPKKFRTRTFLPVKAKRILSQWLMLLESPSATRSCQRSDGLTIAPTEYQKNFKRNVPIKDEGGANIP